MKTAIIPALCLLLCLAESNAYAQSDKAQPAIALTGGTLIDLSQSGHGTHEKLLNTDGKVEFQELVASLREDYKSRKAPVNAIVRDLNRLGALGAVWIEKADTPPKTEPKYYISVVLDWPSKITEAEFFAKIAAMPKSKTYGWLSPS